MESRQRNLQKMQEIQLFKTFQAQFNELDTYLIAINALHPDWIKEIMQEYNKILIEKMNHAQNITVYKMQQFDQSNWKIIHKFEKKIEQLQRTMLTFLGFEHSTLQSKEELQINDMIEVTFSNYVQFGYFHVYYVFQAISNLKGNVVAHNLAKRIAKDFYSKPRTNRKKFEDLSEYMKWLGSNCLKTHDFKIANLEDGRICMKVEECMWGEALKGVEDPELMYYFICYGDFFSTPDYNENFVLTRKKTILQNDGICDFCYHYKNNSKKLIHPEESFWKSL
ncbi:L-2-amino-thiazoline-4-carboxylic acid hydrolase [Candidatus Lokiarchaeum ossiferum]|uniref:L-2-amino-thiazoline-4-carboxylic acid hydrolase n=1 Tax=Candidatus Lokiarchaeum ossiferum TaxID=2951803 RepID=UPI00352C2873